MSRKIRPTAAELIRACETSRPERPPSTPDKVCIEPPDRLSAAQQAIWHEVVATVDLRPCDAFILETLVGLLDQQHTLQRSVDENGPLLIQANGKPMHNPAASALRQLEPQLTRIFKELGMSPATRARLKLDNRTCHTGAESRWAQF